MNKIKTLLLLIFISGNLYAQQVSIPSNVEFNNADDYKRTEQLVLDAIEWSQKTPFKKNDSKRTELYAFLMKWMSGSPTVSIALLSGIVPLDQPEILLAFMSGWTKYSLENNYSKDNVECALAGANFAIEFYEQNKSELGRNSEMEKLIKKKKKGDLRKLVASKY